jgi:hypothetical protein
MTSRRTRLAAAEGSAGPDARERPYGMREWLNGLGDGTGRYAAAFDTSWAGPLEMVGSAAAMIADGMEARGFRLVARPATFTVCRDDTLAIGARIGAQLWGECLGWALDRAAGAPPNPRSDGRQLLA